MGTLASSVLGFEDGGEGWAEYSVNARPVCCCLGVSGAWSPFVVTTSVIVLDVRLIAYAYAMSQWQRAMYFGISRRSVIEIFPIEAKFCRYRATGGESSPGQGGCQEWQASGSQL